MFAVAAIRASISRSAGPLRISLTRHASTSLRIRACSLRTFQAASIFGLGLFILGSAQVLKPDVLTLDAKPLETPAAKAKKAPLSRVISFQEVEKHNSVNSAWIIIHAKVYDVTDFLKRHPGGAGVILSIAGQDASALYDQVHPVRFLSTILKPENCLGEVDAQTVPASALEETEEAERIRLAQAEKPPLSAIINMNDFEAAAMPLLTDVAWGYYSSAAEEGSSHENNLSSYSRYEFRPRCLQKTANADPATTILGIATSLPIFVCPTAAAGLGNPEGELSITRGAGKSGIIQCLSNMATRSPEEVAAQRQPNQPLIFQLYIHPDRKKSENMVKQVERLGYKAIMLTVDTTILGKRENDMRAKALSADVDESQLGIARQMGSFYDENLGWDALPWLRGITKLPIIIKGIQCVEDVEIAHEHGAAAVVLSNHGGRQLAYALASIDILYELRQRRPDLLSKMDVFIDGGVRRGTDVVKALCLGAKGVGMGRPFLYANSAYVMRDEVIRTMRLLGASSIDELRPEMVARRNW